MVDNKITNMEVSPDEGSSTEKPPSAKRPRSRIPEVEEDSVEDSFLREARSIQENLRVFLFDKKLTNKTRNYINGKVDQIIDLLVTLNSKVKSNENEHKGVSVSALVQKVVKETLESPSVVELISNKLMEKSKPMEAPVPSSSEITINRLPILTKPGPSKTTEAETSLTEAATFQVVKSKRARKKAKAQQNKIELNQDKTEDGILGKPDEKPSIEYKPKTLAQIVKSLPTKPTMTAKSTYLTISGPGKTPGDIISGLPSPNELGINASIVRATKAGSVLVRLEDSSHAKKIIGWQELRAKGLQAKLALRKKPKVEVKGVPQAWGAAELARFLWDRLPEKSGSTPLVQDDLRPLFSSVARNGFTKNWVLEVHPMVRFQLLEMGTLEGGWWTLMIKDYLDAPRCTKCQGYGHTKATCTVDALVCIWCAGSNHVMKECQKKKDMTKPTCINCLRENNCPSQSQHKSGSRECPVHIKWCKEVAKRTFYE